MRDKQDILGQIHTLELRGGADLIAITGELRILAEVLIDIRDMLNDLTTSLRLFAKHLDLKK